MTLQDSECMLLSPHFDFCLAFLRDTVFLNLCLDTLINLTCFIIFRDPFVVMMLSIVFIFSIFFLHLAAKLVKWFSK